MQRGTVSALGVAAKVSPEFTALPAVAGELGAIVRSADNPQGAFPGQVYLNDRFTAERYRQVIEEGQPVIHLATHFKFSPGVESQNYLLLGDGQSLSLSDMMSRRFQFRNLDLLTLSGMRDGAWQRGDRQWPGSGKPGRARAQLHGASSVIATLWQVADESTGQLMKAFYGIRAGNPGMNKAEAMRRAQKALLEGQVDQTAAGQASRSASARVPQSGVPGLRFQADPAETLCPSVLLGAFCVDGELAVRVLPVIQGKTAFPHYPQTRGNIPEPASRPCRAVQSCRSNESRYSPGDPVGQQYGGAGFCVSHFLGRGSRCRSGLRL